MGHLHRIVIALALTLTACADGSSGTDEQCEPAPECLGATTGDTFCHGNVQRTCQEDADGCMALVENDCSKSGAHCDDSGGSAICVGCHDTACESAMAGSQVCGNSNVMQCTADVDGCLRATTVQNCVDEGLVCGDAGAGPLCRSDCDDAACLGAEEGDGICQGQILSTCKRDQAGCLKSVQQDCTLTGGTCDASGDQPLCIGGCAHEPLCDGYEANSSRCMGYGILFCGDSDANGCLEASITTHCEENLCSGDSPPACATSAPSGNTCVDAIPIEQSGFRIANTFNGTYSDNQEFTGTDCIPTSGVPELTLKVDLREGDELRLVQDMSTGTESPVTFSVQTSCDAAAACETSIAASSLSFIAGAVATYYVVIEATVPPGPANTITVDAYINPICGNGFLDPGETCDDGNEIALDGCSSTCRVERNFSCTSVAPSHCVAIP